MTIINNFITEYGTLLLYTAITAIAGVIAAYVKKIYTEKVNTKTKKQVAKTVVTAIEQLYKDLNGEEKKQKAIEAMSEMLAEKGITITPLEINMLIEAAVGEFNEVWNKEDNQPLGIEDDEDHDVYTQSYYYYTEEPKG